MTLKEHIKITSMQVNMPSMLRRVRVPEHKKYTLKHHPLNPQAVQRMPEKTTKTLNYTHTHCMTKPSLLPNQKGRETKLLTTDAPRLSISGGASTSLNSSGGVGRAAGRAARDHVRRPGAGAGARGGPRSQCKRPGSAGPAEVLRCCGETQAIG